ncbi:hypothetical protein BS47DRAFT_394813 [Hydnum rufescens UP504]|uniref:Uncharacterized protein n=1 Tax=Hydnum rufescens UP504 TaxID=1448309 RepID=A0A9P6DPS0_9AGAM|nr:hypothetical protein BS47DRAFT_394813 [Hydnum rufescens UP504]
MRKTMTLNIGENKTHFINFYNPYMQLDPQEALPQPSSLPLFTHLTYDLRPDILFTKHRQPPIVNIMTAGNVERFVYGGEYGADLPERHAHIQGAIKYWTQRLKVVPEVRPLKVDPHSKLSKPSVCEDTMPGNTSESDALSQSRKTNSKTELILPWLRHHSSWISPVPDQRTSGLQIRSSLPRGHSSLLSHLLPFRPLHPRHLRHL